MMTYTAMVSDAQRVEVTYCTDEWLNDAGVQASGDPAKRLAVIDHQDRATFVLYGDPSWMRQRIAKALKLLIEDGVDIPADLFTTDEEFPQLWGQGEIAAFAERVADGMGKRRPGKGRFWTWEGMAGFPKPVARLAGANVWLAADLVPYLIERISADRLSTTPIDDATRAEILAEHGVLTARATAVKYGVGLSTVQRIWRGTR